MPEKSILVENKKLHYQIEGSGQVVILLHGFAEDHTVWQKQINFLKEKFCVIAPDIPGSGKSELSENISMESIANAVLQIIDEEHIKQITLIGHSMGGYAALAFAEQYPERLQGVGLFHSTASADTVEKREARKKGIAFIKKNGVREFIQSTANNLFADNTRQYNSALIQSFTQSLPDFTEEALIAYYTAMMNREDKTNLLTVTALPVLFVIGQDDHILSFEDVLKQASMPQQSVIHILEKSGHQGMLEEPEKTNIILQDFLTFVNKINEA